MAQLRQRVQRQRERGELARREHPALRESGAAGSQPLEPRVAKSRPRKPRKTIYYPLLSKRENQQELQDLRLQLGTPESRRRLRYGFRASSDFWEHSRPCYVGSCIANASQAPHFVPTTVKSALKRANPIDPRSVHSQIHNDNLVEKLSGLELYIQLPSRPGSVISS